MLEILINLDGRKITPLKTHIIINNRVYYFDEYYYLIDFITNKLSSYTHEEIIHMLKCSYVLFDVSNDFLRVLYNCKKFCYFNKISVTPDKTFLLNDEELILTLENKQLNKNLETINNKYILEVLK